MDSSMTKRGSEYHDQGMVGGLLGPVLCTIMKKTLLTLSAVLLAAAMQAQTSVTVSTAAANSEQVWYSLLNGEVDSAPLAEWDVAFEITGFASSIRVNTAKGLVVYETPDAIDQWDNVVTVDMDNWTRVDNADTSWSISALNNGNDLDDPLGFNVGWGNYNQATHVVVGTHIYAIMFPDSSWKKLRINSLAAGVYDFTYANLDGTDNHDATLAKNSFVGKHFGYWSFDSNATIDREPLAMDWDLLFTKYTGFVPTPYPVSGVLQNKNVTAQQVDGVPTADAQWSPGLLSVHMNIIGSDWKSYDMDQNVYTIVADRTYFVKDVPGNIWKVIFTGYGGGSNGNMTFTQEMLSPVGIQETTAQQGTLLVYPNPVTNGQAQVIMDIPASEGTLRVFNTTGQQMLEHRFSGLAGLSNRTLDVSNLAKGVYVVRIEANHSNTTAKLVID